MSDTGETESSTRDPAQIVPPYLDTRLTLWIIPVREFLYFTPALGAFTIAWVAAVTNIPGVFIAASVIGGVFTLGALALIFGTHEFTTPRDRLRAVRTALRNRLRYPWTQDDAQAASVHGVEKVYADGTALMEDGRIVGLVRVAGRNIDLQSENEANHLVGRLSDGIDEHIQDFDFRFFSTTTPFDPERIAGKYREMAFSEEFGGDAWVHTRELLHDIADWIEHTDSQRWGARQWHQYIVVEVHPFEVSVSERERAATSRARRLWNVLVPGSHPDHDRRTRQRSELADQLATIENAVLGSIPGVDGEAISATEHALLLARYWTGIDHEIDPTTVNSAVDAAVFPWASDDSQIPNAPTTLHPAAVDTDGEDTGTAAVSPEAVSASEAAFDADDETQAGVLQRVRNGLFTRSRESADGGTSLPEADRIQDLLAPSTYDPRDGYTRIGEQYCRTFWIASWPTEPDAHVLRDLYTMRGVDVDVCIRAKARDKRTTIDELKHRIAEVDANALEREEDTDISALAADETLEALVKMYELLRQTNSQPWDVAGYVTVRAGTRRALDHAEAEIEDGLAKEADLSLDIAKHRALEADVDQVRTALESAPADCFVLASEHRQGDLFSACAPTARDAYDEGSTRDRYTLTLGGTLGALFPFCAERIDDADGIEFGRRMQTGNEIIADPFDRGGAPHGLTIGMSGSGKTYSVGKRALRWWLADPDRTLIVCDTMGGFSGLTQLVNGEHVVVDGSQTINPLAIQRAPTEVLQSADVDPYRMKIDEAREFIAGILRAQGLAPGEYVATIEEALEATYAAAGIHPDEPATHGRGNPTMADYLDTLEDMLENPGVYTHTDHERELSRKEEQASRLLDKLSGFKEHGKYSHLVGQSEVEMTPGGVTYIDLQQIEGQGAADKSTMLHLMLGQVYQLVKRAPEKTMFVVDEAHYLLHSAEMIEWLQRAARHWRHYEAAMWFVSQSPQEFVGDSDDEDSEHRETITGQCSTVEFFRTPNLAPEIAGKFGLNERQRTFVRSGITPGDAGLGYSQALVQFDDKPGWRRTHVAASPFEDAILTYEPSEGRLWNHLADQVSRELPEAPTASPPTAESSPPVQRDPTAVGDTTDGTAPDDIEAIHGIGPTYGDRLRASGIETVAALRETAPMTIAEVADAPLDQAKMWHQRAGTRNDPAAGVAD